MSERAIYQLLWLANSIDDSLAENLSSSLDKFASSISSDDSSILQKRKALEQLSGYLKRKADELSLSVLDDNFYNLRKLRNDLMHSKVRRDMDLTLMYPLLWKAIAKLADRIGPYEVENLLAYSLFVDNKHFASRGLSPSKVVSEYRTMFRKFDEERKRIVFVELLLRLFSDNESMSLLDVG